MGVERRGTPKMTSRRTAARSRLLVDLDHRGFARRQVAVDRRVAEFGQHAEALALARFHRDGRVGVVEIAEHTRMRRASQHACRLPLGCGQRLVVDPVHAQRAFLHRAGILVELTRPVRTSPRAVVAAHALVWIN